MFIAILESPGIQLCEPKFLNPFLANAKFNQQHFYFRDTFNPALEMF